MIYVRIISCTRLPLCVHVARTLVTVRAICRALYTMSNLFKINKCRHWRRSGVFIVIFQLISHLGVSIFWLWTSKCQYFPVKFASSCCFSESILFLLCLTNLGWLEYLRLNFVSLCRNEFYLISCLDFMLNLNGELSCHLNNFLEEISNYI